MPTTRCGQCGRPAFITDQHRDEGAEAYCSEGCARGEPRPAPHPWRYAPESDTDGFTIGTDHFVLDADGNEVCVAPDEPTARLLAAAPLMLEQLARIRRLLADVLADDLIGGAAYPFVAAARNAAAKALSAAAGAAQ